MSTEQTIEFLSPERPMIPMAKRRFGSWQLAVSRQAQTTKELAGEYDGVANKWARTARRYRLDAAYREVLMASTVPNALTRTRQTARVLDCGIGTGSLTFALDEILPRPVNYHGVDASDRMLREANAAAQQAGVSISLQQANILSLPFKDASFDFVMAAHVLEHLPEPKLALEEMLRVLEPGGKLFLCATRPSLFGAFIQLRWRTWAVSEQQGCDWLHNFGLSNIGLRPLRFGSFAGQASTAFWAQKPTTTEQASQ